MVAREPFVFDLPIDHFRSVRLLVNASCSLIIYLAFLCSRLMAQVPALLPLIGLVSNTPLALRTPGAFRSVGLFCDLEDTQHRALDLTNTVHPRKITLINYDFFSLYSARDISLKPLPTYLKIPRRYRNRSLWYMLPPSFSHLARHTNMVPSLPLPNGWRRRAF